MMTRLADMPDRPVTLRSKGHVPFYYLAAAFDGGDGTVTLSERDYRRVVRAFRAFYDALDLLDSLRADY